MPYYRGDYVGGGSNYYRGDPFIGGLIKAGVGLVRGAVKRTIGGIRNDGARAATRVLTATGIGAGIPPVLMGFGNPAPGLQIPFGGGTINPGGILPGGRPFWQGSTCKPGYHMDKKFGVKCVRNRRMNPLNPRALKRALRRAEGFEKFARQTVNALRSGPKKFKKISARG